MKKLIFYILIVVGLIFLFTKPTGLGQEAPELDDLKFSNTMEWDPQLLTIANKQTRYITDWQDKIILDPPPINSQSSEELAILLSYKEKRTNLKQIEIIEQINLNSSKLGSRLISDYFDESQFPFTAQLLKETMGDLDVIILNSKEKYDRVRPHFLEPNIEPSIEVPNHPAYPSGHSTQTHFLAYVLGELIPDKKEIMIAEADLIALNREIAGLHYPSDSSAGVSLARQFWDLVRNDPEFLVLLEKARQEWVDML